MIIYNKNKNKKKVIYNKKYIIKIVCNSTCTRLRPCFNFITYVKGSCKMVINWSGMRLDPKIGSN